jgi:hypothetical protein
MNNQKFLTKTLWLATLLSLIIAVITAVCIDIRWGLGFLIGALWSILNFSLTITILAFINSPVSKLKVLSMLIVKFPILYGLGFFILVSHFFTTKSILWGVGTILIVMGLTILCRKLTRISQNYPI